MEFERRAELGVVKISVDQVWPNSVVVHRQSSEENYSLQARARPCI
jgi:hypothetical protein